MKEWTDYDDAVKIFVDLFGDDGRKWLHEKIESGEIAAQAMDFSFTRGFGVTRTVHPGVPNPYFWRYAVPVEGQSNALKIPHEYFDEEGCLTTSPWNEEASRVQIRDADIASFQQAHKSAAPAATPRKSSGGRPPDYYWEDILIEMARINHVEGLPPTQAAMTARIQQWYADKHGSEPGETETKKRVSKFFNAIRSET